MKGNCEICGNEIEIKICCSGVNCGCMGLPTEPPVCSELCYLKYKIDKEQMRKEIDQNETEMYYHDLPE